MHKQYRVSDHSSNNRLVGFSLVELIVVIAVIGILSAISIALYLSVEQQSKDDKRNADIIVFQAELEKFYEKNGEYPPGCPQDSCTSWFISENTSAPITTSSTTLTTLRATLSGLPSDFGDPRSSSITTPIMLRTETSKEYYYFGGTVNNRTTASSYAMSSSTAMPCTIQSPLSAGEVGSYVVGYFSEVNNKWILHGGKQGKPMVVTSGTTADGCVINKS